MDADNKNRNRWKYRKFHRTSLRENEISHLSYSKQFFVKFTVYEIMRILYFLSDVFGIVIKP